MTNHPQYDAMLANWAKMRIVTSDQAAVHTAGPAFLPRLSKMTDAQYDAYKARASFMTFTKRAIEAFSGMVMRKPTMVEGTDIKNIDGKGSSINDYIAKPLLPNYLVYGRSGTLVDLPPAGDDVITVADAIEKNITPRALFYKAADIVNWKTSDINNVEQLSMVVLREKVDISTDEFSHDYEYRYRVLDLVDGKYRQRVFDEDGEQVTAPIFPLRSDKPLKFIPFTFHGGVEVQYPPLLSIADQNLSHYRLDADYKHGLHYVALPTPWVTDINEDDPNAPTTIGPEKIWYLPADSKCGMLEFTGMGLGEIRKAKTEIVEAIVLLASRILDPQKSSYDESAAAASIRSQTETSTLAELVTGLSKEMTQIVQTIVWWNGGDAGDIKVNVNTDFTPSTLTGADVLSYIKSWIEGGISYESMFNVLKKGEIIRGDKKLEQEKKEITDEQIARMKAEADAKTKADKEAADAADKKSIGEDTDGGQG